LEINYKGNMKILHSNGKGGVTVLWSTAEWAGTMKELGEKCVPKGLPFKIVEDSDVPDLADEFRNAWEVDEAELTDGVGA
jgi:hypothetical protein